MSNCLAMGIRDASPSRHASEIAFRAACHHEQHVGRADRAAGGGADRAAGDAQRREPEVTEDQDVGDDDVDDVGEHRRRQRRPAIAGAA